MRFYLRLTTLALLSGALISSAAAQGSGNAASDIPEDGDETPAEYVPEAEGAAEENTEGSETISASAAAVGLFMLAGSRPNPWGAKGALPMTFFGHCLPP